MNFIDYYKEIIATLPGLKLKSSYIAGGKYELTELNKLRRTINVVQNIPYIQDEIVALRNSLFSMQSDNQTVDTALYTLIESPLRSLVFKLEFMQKLAESSRLFGSTDVLLIRIPEIDSFDNLEKYAKDFKKAIEIPIIDSGTKGKVAILGADEGSIILYVSLGTVVAVTLIGKICWAAAVYKKKKAEAKIFEQHAKN